MESASDIDREERDGSDGVGGHVKGKDEKKPLRRQRSFKQYIEEAWSPFLVRTLNLLVLTVPLVFTFGSVFTSPMGWGWEILEVLARFANVYRLVMLSGVAFLFLLYIFDFSHWDDNLFWKSLRYIGIAIGVTTLLISGCLAAKDYPGFPALLFFVVTPAYFYAIKILVFAKVENFDFFFSLSAVNLIVGLVSFPLYMAWVANLDLFWKYVMRHK